ncbi:MULTISPECIES: glycosyltransferase family 4 protein [Methanoculleus]|jgi:starch synthase|uniref:Glycosyltransferase involved in cell wall bisynthesis n=1 Tax=Methanoculleus thermophilus TaxID=2200 RepID=A0A1G9B8D7_9EURY|nr:MULTISPECIES: glycosyltransferase family 4 protein [Methanoculleus]NLN08761.1 glycosyltransferase family 4 protein [Methanoculleus thermophilus]SDK35743.1 Glycosyltransferase involved in cell wall bisynthesis [Methanoculleus thermophilus]HQD25909.1 glycosyltransferase family 4 protein [Methanoculleus thermophilus]
MRVACLTFWFYDYTIQMANELARHTDVLLLLPDYRSEEYLESIDPRVRVRVFGYSQYAGRLGPSCYPMLREIVAAIDDFGPDIVHYQVNNPMLCPLLLMLRKYPLVATFHDIEPHAGEDRLLDLGSLLYRLTLFVSRIVPDRIFVHGKALKKALVEDYRVPDQKVRVIPIGEHEVTPFKKYEKVDLRPEGHRILFFGRIHRYKGLECLIQAEPFITREIPDARIVIAGTGEDFGRYRAAMAGRDAFEVYNYRIPYEEGARLFQQASVVVLPYIEASQSGVIPTAYGFRRPVVVTDVGSLPEVVDDGKTGYIVPPRDPTALADAIVRLLKDPEACQRMGEQGYIKLKTDMAWSTIVQSLLAVYSEIVPASEIVEKPADEVLIERTHAGVRER